MTVYLIRHGIAEPRGPDLPDPDRALTPKGTRRVRQVARGLRRQGVVLDRLYHSPWRRAVETAELLAPLVAGETVVSPWLAEPPSPALLEHLEGEEVALVGHEPWLSALLAWLVHGGDVPPAEGPYDLRKGGVAILQGTPAPGQMVLTALLPPRLLRRRGGRGSGG